MLTEQVKTLIEKESELSPRLSGVFFRKHLNQSMYADDGQLTPFAIECHSYFQDLKRSAEKKAFESRLQQERAQHEQHQASIKKANQSVSKSANQSRARFIGSLRFELNAGVLVVHSVSKSIQYPAKLIRRYLKTLGVSHLGKTLLNGVSFSGDAVTNILAALQVKQAKNDTIPTGNDTLPLNFDSLRCLQSVFQILSPYPVFCNREAN
jgi:ATPase subunit of ABC transporter with duplicated ATPase domains